MKHMHKRQDERNAIPPKTEEINHFRFPALRCFSASDIVTGGAAVVLCVAETEVYNL